MLPVPGGSTLCAKAAGWAKAEGRTRQECGDQLATRQDPGPRGGSQGNKREHTLDI